MNETTEPSRLERLQMARMDAGRRLALLTAQVDLELAKESEDAAYMARSEARIAEAQAAIEAASDSAADEASAEVGRLRAACGIAEEDEEYPEEEDPEGTLVYARGDSTQYGVTTGVERDCDQVEDCRGDMLEKHWPDGTYTWCCTAGLCDDPVPGSLRIME